MRISTLAACLLATGAIFGQQIQGPAAPWRTLHTRHYRIHYPEGPRFETFAKEVSGCIEGVHTLLEGWVGHTLEQKVDVVVRDPAGTANGSSFPVLFRPKVELWVTPPEQGTALGESESWVELLVLHELVHHHHLTIPDRGKLGFRLPGLPLSFSRVMKRSPGWVIEGYATLLEGRLTGEGRPHGAFRAMIMRQWARDGMLPTYENMSNAPNPLGGASRYLIGSAFLAWLQDQYQDRPKILQELWQRLASSRYAGFDPAFSATFGRSAKVLYGRFTAEVGHAAVELEQRLKVQGFREGTPFLERNPGGIRHLSVSPDGSRLVAQIGGQKPALEIWKVKDEPADPKKGNAAAKKPKDTDPTLLASVKPLVPERSPEKRLGRQDFLTPSHPRWNADGSIAYRALRTNAEGVFQWVDRAWTPLKLATITPTLRTLVPVRQGRDHALEIQGQRLTLPFAPYGNLVWDTAGHQLYASTALDGVLNIVRVTFDPTSKTPFGPLQVLTRTVSAAMEPAPTPDGKTLFFTLATAYGTQIRSLDLTQAPLEPIPPQTASTLAPGTVRPNPSEPTLVPRPATPPPSVPYTWTESHAPALRIGFVTSPASKALQLGYGGSDVLGQVEWNLMGSFELPGAQGRGPRGVGGALIYRGFAWNPSLQASSYLERPSRQDDNTATQLDLERRGLSYSQGWTWSQSATPGQLSLMAGVEQIQALSHPQSPWVRRQAVALDAMQQIRFNQGNRTSGLLAQVQAGQGRTEAENWGLQRFRLGLSSHWQSGAGLDLEAEMGRASKLGGPLDGFHLGGIRHTLQSQVLDLGRVTQPGLPAWHASGNRLQRLRASFSTPIRAQFSLDALAVWEAPNPRPAYVRVANVFMEYRLEDSSLRNLLGSMEFQWGLHHILNGPLKNKTTFSAAVLHRF
ncbi:MAG: hypothetical protein Q8O00_10365 [Holophaga sp.]|nr:hypothetical protein [Holophaga sp.]